MDFFNARDDLEDIPLELNGESEIQKIYNGAHILITGSSGFIGKLLLEKLLRSCDVGKIYLLMRKKKDTVPHERLKALLNDIVFERVKMEKPNISKKLQIIAGDCSLPGLNISDRDYEVLSGNVSFIFHVAAALNMEEHLRKTYMINVCATKSLLEMAKKMEHLKAFVYVSTAFSHFYRTYTDEIFYDTKLSEDDVQLIIEKFDDIQIGALTPKVVGEWCNTYAFSKAIAENLIQKYSSHIPVAVVRPSMVISTASEPIAGWSSNIYGPSGIVMITYIGLLRVWKCKDTLLDMVPVDTVVNTIIAVGWHTCVKKPTGNNQRIFNVVSSVKNPITINEFQKKVAEVSYDMYVPTMKSVGIYNMHLVENDILFTLYTWYFHVLPAFLIDLILKLTGKTTRLMKGYVKIFNLNRVLYTFVSHNYGYTDRNVDALWELMEPKDRQLFNFLKVNKWESLFYIFLKGLRVYTLEDPMETLNDSRKRYQRLKILTILSYLLQFVLIFYILHLCMGY